LAWLDQRVWLELECLVVESGESGWVCVGILGHCVRALNVTMVWNERSVQWGHGRSLHEEYMDGVAFEVGCRSHRPGFGGGRSSPCRKILGMQRAQRGSTREWSNAR